MRYRVKIEANINSSYDITEEVFDNHDDALDYLNVKARAWKQVDETMDSLDWYKLSIERD